MTAKIKDEPSQRNSVSKNGDMPPTDLLKAAACLAQNRTEMPVLTANAHSTKIVRSSLDRALNCWALAHSFCGITREPGLINGALLPPR